MRFAPLARSEKSRLSYAMNKSQRASETQSVRSIKQSISSIKKEISPVPTVRPCSSNPKARPLTRTTWIRRIVRVPRTGATAATVTFEDIGTILGALGSEAYTVKILGVKAWNVTGPATTANAISLQMGTAVVLSGSALIQGEDYGNGSVLAGVSINIPDVLSAVNVTTSTSTAFTVSSPLGGSVSQNYVLDISVAWQV